MPPPVHLPTDRDTWSVHDALRSQDLTLHPLLDDNKMTGGLSSRLHEVRDCHCLPAVPLTTTLGSHEHDCYPLYPPYAAPVNQMVSNCSLLCSRGYY